MSKLVAPELFKSIQPKKTHIVDVVVSSATLGDLTKVNHITAQILGAYGCPGCTSGLDIRFRAEEEVILHELNGELKASTYQQVLAAGR